jgi:hypothetical protein
MDRDAKGIAKDCRATKEMDALFKQDIGMQVEEFA